MRWDICLLGPVEIRRDGETIAVSAPQQRAVIAALALETGRVVSADRLIESLWGEEPPPTARATVQSLVKRLRRALGPQIVQARAPGYQVVVEPDTVDVSRFTRLAAEGRRALATGDPATAAERSRAALALWRGEALLDVTAEPLRRRVLPALSERYLVTWEARLAADLSLGRGAEVVAELRSLVVEHPLRESLHRLLMSALHGAGRRAEAVETYWSLRRSLVQALGVEPDESTRRLHQRLLTPTC